MSTETFEEINFRQKLSTAAQDRIASTPMRAFSCEGHARNVAEDEYNNSPQATPVKFTDGKWYISQVTEEGEMRIVGSQGSFFTCGSV